MSAVMSRDSSSAPVVELENVSKWYGPTQVLKSINLQANAGKVLVILGDNGAGKSTLVKILSGVERISEGNYLFKGSRIEMRSPRIARELGIATVFQDLAICPMLSIARNIVLGNEPKRRVGPLTFLDMPEARRQARAALSQLGVNISRDETELAARLSGGERQSVAIARAVHFGASCLMLDEPTSALAVRQAGKVLDSIAVARDRGQAVIMITHNFNHAMEIADQIVIVRQGEIVSRMKPAETSITEISRFVSGS